MTTIQEMRTKINQQIGRRDLLIEQKAELEKELIEKTDLLEKTKKARAILQIVAKNIQKTTEIRISKLVSMIIAYVFPDPYEFQLKFIERRNVTEADMLFIKNGHVSDDILNTGGGGVADVASVGLCLSLFSLRKTRPTFLFDEPTKYVHNPEYQIRCSELFKSLCSKLNMQIIIISDQKNMIAAADNVINIENDNGQSYVQNSIDETQKPIIRRRIK